MFCRPIHCIIRASLIIFIQRPDHFYSKGMRVFPLILVGSIYLSIAGYCSVADISLVLALFWYCTHLHSNGGDSLSFLGVSGREDCRLREYKGKTVGRGGVPAVERVPRGLHKRRWRRGEKHCRGRGARAIAACGAVISATVLAAVVFILVAYGLYELGWYQCGRPFRGGGRTLLLHRRGCAGAATIL